MTSRDKKQEMSRPEVTVHQNDLPQNWRKLGTTEKNTKTPAGGGSAYERGGEARPKFWIKPLKETDQGVAQGFFDP